MNPRPIETMIVFFREFGIDASSAEHIVHATGATGCIRRNVASRCYGMKDAFAFYDEVDLFPGCIAGPADEGPGFYVWTGTTVLDDDIPVLATDGTWRKATAADLEAIGFIAPAVAP